MVTRFYYTLNELQDEELTENQRTFKTLFEYWVVDSYIAGNNETTLYQHLQEEYGDDFCCYIDIQHPYWEEVDKPTIIEILTEEELVGLKEQIKKQIRKIKAWLEDSHFRYDKLISLFTTQEAKLLEQVEATSTVQFNDTPHTPADSGKTLLDDEFATTYTKNISKADAGTVLTRLNEVRNGWFSLYAEWIYEYATKFVLY